MKLSKRWLLVSAFGHGVLAALGLRAVVRVWSALLGMKLSENTPGYVFLFGSLVLGSLFVAMTWQRIKHLERKVAARAATS
jgi:hypothetical protein